MISVWGYDGAQIIGDTYACPIFFFIMLFLLYCVYSLLNVYSISRILTLFQTPLLWYTLTSSHIYEHGVITPKNQETKKYT